ncbi:MAG TPA: methylated-DNA--[protein]-cysteine S-methyltransferase [Burkholderiales bacterium]|nr:methylated-DNA--[protein]-cysteine S-methyltransferase [Burkholderiales bacterium]
MRGREADCYDAVIEAPFARLGVIAAAAGLRRIDFLPESHAVYLPASAPAPVRRLAAALTAYWRDASQRFELPLSYRSTDHQRRVWQALLKIPVGSTRTYGAIAAELGSSPRAVGQACGANPLPILIPCHRAVAKNGHGGFMHQREGAALDYKLWLLEHESRYANAD